MTVIDATAGWGKDAWLLASLGCQVLAVERSNVVSMLLRDGILRAGVRRPTVLARVRLVIGDSRYLLRHIAALRQAESVGREAVTIDEPLPEDVRGFLRPDVVYLDPMFPGAKKRKSAEKNSMQVLRRLVGSDEDAGELFGWAMRAAGKRVVVKRPANGGLDFGMKPVATHRGKAFCFDVYAARTPQAE